MFVTVCSTVSSSGDSWLTNALTRTFVVPPEQPELRSDGQGSSDREFLPSYKAQCGPLKLSVSASMPSPVSIRKPESPTPPRSKQRGFTPSMANRLFRVRHRVYVSVFSLPLKGRFKRTDTPTKRRFRSPFSHPGFRSPSTRHANAKAYRIA